jgi:gas vesicle protein
MALRRRARPDGSPIEREDASMATEDSSSIADVIRKASEAFAETLSTVNKAINDIAAQAGASVDRDQMVDNWLRAARMGKDGMVRALEQGYDWWERQVREQLRRAGAAAGTGSAKKPANPMEAWAENWRKMTESFSDSGKWSEEARKQAEVVQKTLQEGLRAWQRMWEPEKKEPERKP